MSIPYGNSPVEMEERQSMRQPGNSNPPRIIRMADTRSILTLQAMIAVEGVHR